MIFYFRLARELGMTVGRLLAQMSSREIAGWLAFLSIEDDIEKTLAEDAKRKKAATEEKVLQARLTQAGQIVAAKKKRIK